MTQTVVAPILLIVREAALYLRVHPQTLHSWRYAGKGPPYIHVGRKIMYRPEDLDAWLMERRVVHGQ